jgi:hypothetical protein
MIIPKIIFIFNTVAWLLPPFRQRGCKYFLYFLILALSDPVFSLIDWIHPSNSTPYYLFVSTLILVTLLKKKILLLSLLIVILLSIYLSNPEIRLFTSLVHFMILLYFLKEMIVIISRESKIIIFNLVLVLYEASVFFKFTASYLEITGILYFYITTAFEVFIAIFFTIYNEKNSPVINLQMEPTEID